MEAGKDNIMLLCDFVEPEVKTTDSVNTIKSAYSKFSNIDNIVLTKKKPVSWY